MTLSIKNSGSWVTPQKIFVKNAGAWAEVKNGYIKDGGVWKPFYSSGPSADLGEHWTLLTNQIGSTTNNQGVIRHGTSRWIVYGYSNGAYSHYSSDGINWTTCSGILPTNTMMWDMKYINETIGTIAVGCVFVNPKYTKIWRSLDGITFTEVFSEACSAIYTIYGASSIEYNGSNIFVLVNNGSTGSKILSSSNGTTWNTSTTISTFYDCMNKMSFYNGSRIGFYYRENSFTYKMIYSDNGGSTWLYRNGIGGSTTTFQNHIHERNDNGAMVFTKGNTLYISYDGESWTPKITSDSGLLGITFIQQINRWIVCDDAGFFYSDNDGSSWTGVFNSVAFRDVAYDGSSTLLAITQSGCYSSTN